MVRGLKFRIHEAEGLYYLCSENKGADQLRSYCAADLRLCFRICKMPVFSHNDAQLCAGYIKIKLGRNVAGLLTRLTVGSLCILSYCSINRFHYRTSPCNMQRYLKAQKMQFF